VARELVDLAAFFMQANPAAAFLNVVILNLHIDDRVDAGEGVAHHGNQGPVAEADEYRFIWFDSSFIVLNGFDGFEKGAHLLRREHRGLTFFDAVLRPANGVRGVHGHDLAGDEPIEEHANGGEVLLDRGLGTLGAELLDVRGDMNGLDSLKRQLSFFAPGGKLRDRDEVRAARVAVADVGSKKFPEASAGIFGAQKKSRHIAGRRAYREVDYVPFVVVETGADFAVFDAADNHQVIVN